MLKQIEAVLRDVFEDQDIVAVPELNIRSLKNWDSFNHVNMMIGFEQAFGIEIPVKDAEAVMTVSDVEAILKKQGKA
jgi:acyl carrier protein